MVVLPSVNNPVIHLRIKSAIEVSPTALHYSVWHDAMLHRSVANHPTDAPSTTL